MVNHASISNHGGKITRHGVHTEYITFLFYVLRTKYI